MKNPFEIHLWKIKIKCKFGWFFAVISDFYLGFLLFFVIQIEGIFQVFRVCFLMSFSVISWWLGGLSGFIGFPGFCDDFLLLVCSDENFMFCIDWEAKKPQKFISWAATKSLQKPFSQKLFFWPIFLFCLNSKNRIFAYLQVFSRKSSYCVSLCLVTLESDPLKLNYDSLFENNSSIFFGSFYSEEFQEFCLEFLLGIFVTLIDFRILYFFMFFKSKYRENNS